MFFNVFLFFVFNYIKLKYFFLLMGKHNYIQPRSQYLNERITKMNTMSSKNIRKTPCCKVCLDAGRPDYNTHWVRDRPGGNVVCPYLLSLDCRYCKQKGHTPTHCPTLRHKHESKHAATAADKHEAKKSWVDNEGFVTKTSRGDRTNHKPAPKRVEELRGQAGGSFAAFICDDDEEELVPAVAALFAPTVKPPQLTGYAAALSKPAAVVAPKKEAAEEEDEKSVLPWGGSGLSSIRGQKDGWYESDDEED